MSQHDPYIVWLRITKIPIARCRLCNWVAAENPFQAAAQHLLDGRNP